MLRRTLRRYHRWLGLACATFLVALTITGFALNHTDGLKLDERNISSAWILRLYGIETPAEMPSFDTGGRRITQVGTKLYLDDTEVASTEGSLVGATRAGRYIAAADASWLYVIDEYGALADQVRPADEGIGPIVAIGTIGTKLGLSAEGEIWSYDTETFVFSKLDGSAGLSETISRSALPDPLRESIVRRYRGAGISIERLLLDIHSGRFFGSFGELVLDVIALGFVVLAGSGLWVWLKPRS